MRHLVLTLTKKRVGRGNRVLGNSEQPGFKSKVDLKNTPSLKRILPFLGS